MPKIAQKHTKTRCLSKSEVFKNYIYIYTWLPECKHINVSCSDVISAANWTAGHVEMRPLGIRSHRDPGLVWLGLSHPSNLKQPKNMVPNKEYRSNTKPEFRLGLWKCNWIWLGDGICPSQTARALFWTPGTLPLALGGSGWQAWFFFALPVPVACLKCEQLDWTTSQADGLIKSGQITIIH